MKVFQARMWVLIVALTATYSSVALGDEPRVYFEKECLAMFANHPQTSIGENETKVEEGHGVIRFEKTVVTESRDGVAETYIQVRNCSALEPSRTH